MGFGFVFWHRYFALNFAMSVQSDMVAGSTAHACLLHRRNVVSVDSHEDQLTFAAMRLARPQLYWDVERDTEAQTLDKLLVPPPGNQSLHCFECNLY
jgi:hypothetical protein